MMGSPILVGFVLGVAIVQAARALHFDRDRSFYPTVLIVIASYYVLFAVMAEAPFWKELGVAALFALIAVVGYRTRTWLVGVGLLLHGILDLAHGQWFGMDYVPTWWPGLCLGTDTLLGAAVLWMAYRVRKSHAAGDDASQGRGGSTVSSERTL